MVKKKLQVFVSSTFVDLKEERQEAVQAILNSDHIPAGMELFKASNESQLETVKKWIKESDIYMLILGRRYGSIEQYSGLSYTEVEYDYAIEQGIPVFALIMEEGYLLRKQAEDRNVEIFEQENQQKLQGFEKKVKTRMIKETSSLEQIAIEVGRSIKNLENDPNIDFRGWVRPDNLKEELKVSNCDIHLESDQKRLAEIVSFFEENHNLEEFESIAAHCSYEYEIIDKINSVINESEKPSKKFNNKKIQGYYDIFLEKFKKFDLYLIVNFFDKKRMNPNRYFLHPDLKSNYASPSDPIKYSEYVRELNNVVKEMVSGYEQFIRDTRKITG